MQKQAHQQGHHTDQYVHCIEYPPSTKAISELSPIGLADLLLETHHRDKIVFVRTIDSAIRIAAIQSLVEDSSGAVEKLALYNSDPTVNAEDLLPEGALLAVKEPYYTIAEGGHGLRIDHPSDLVQSNPRYQQVPDSFRFDAAEECNKSASEFKQAGNDAYKKGSYFAALWAYGQGVDACSTEDADIRHDILRNRAIVNTYLRRFEAALSDAKASIIPGKDHEEKIIALNAKAHFRAGRAAYNLAKFQEAQACFKTVQELTPSDKDALFESEKIDNRLREQSTGDYDFPKMSKSTSKKHNRLDHADWTSGTIVRETQGRGKGLFAAKNFAAGDLILCEKAFNVAFDSDRVSQPYTVLNDSTKRASTGTQATLLFNVIQKCIYNPEQATRLFDLYDGKDSARGTPLQIVEGLVPVDIFRVQGVLGCNSFECPTVRSSSATSQKQAGSNSTGLWLRAAYINHACDGNSMRSFIGDMMILRASKDISKGEEILMPYRLPEADNAVTQSELEKTWGFRCDCGICAAEAASSFSLRKQRSELLERTTTFCAANPPSVKKNIAQLEKLVAKLEKTYDNSEFEARPRLGLVSPGLWLCQAYKLSASPDKEITTATDLLRNLGFIVSVNGSTVDIDRRNCQVHSSAINGAMFAAHAFYKKGASDIGKQMEEFAKSLYRIMNGELRGFEDSFGKP